MLKTIFSGVSPSGNLTLGNYLGAIKNWLDLAEKNNCYFSIVDLHALTTLPDKDTLSTKTKEVLALYLAAGINPKKTTIFIQSHVPAHTELSWILGNITKVSELKRMTQYKEKSQLKSENVNAGLFTYPILMTADILLYDTDVVPVGIDQKQHVELARTLAKRFNNRYGNTFTIPEVKINKTTAKIYSLGDPNKKMSKSDLNANNYIALTDSAEITTKKISRAVTDSENDITFDPKNKPGIANLLSILSALSGTDIEKLEKEYPNSNYGEFKNDVADEINKHLAPLRDNYQDLIKNEDKLQKIASDGAAKANEVANKKLDQVKEAIGII